MFAACSGSMSKFLFLSVAVSISFSVCHGSEQQLKQSQSASLPILRVAATPGCGRGLAVTLEKGVDVSIDAQALTKKLTESPEELLRAMNTFESEQLDPELQKHEADKRGRLSFIDFAWFQQACQKCPLGLIGECTDPGCPPNRLEHPEVRKKFEDELTDKIIGYLQDHNEVTVTDFGCGGLFQTAVILSKLNKKLADKGWRKTITVNLIDWKHKDELLTCLKKQSAGIITADIFDKENMPRGYWLRYNAYRLVQFLMTFQLQGANQYNVCLYDTAWAYLEDVVSNSALASDFLVGIDILNDERACFAYRDFSALQSNETLKVGGFSCLFNGDPGDGITQKTMLSAVWAKICSYRRPIKICAEVVILCAGIWAWYRWGKSYSPKKLSNI